MTRDMDERVEEISRQKAEEIVATLWRDRIGYIDAVNLIATALAQAERERAIQHTCTKCGYVAATQYGENLRAEVERLKADNDELRHVLWLSGNQRADKAEADLARVRAALDEIGTVAITYQSAEKRIKRIIAIYKRAALEGR